MLWFISFIKKATQKSTMKKGYNDNTAAAEDTSCNVHETVMSMIGGGGGRALDLGAGFGLLSKRLKDAGFAVTACELDPERISNVRKLGIECDSVDLDGKLPYKNGKFDIVVSSDVIEHLKSPYNFVQEAGRVTKTGGIFIVSMPNIMNWYSRLKFLVSGVYNNYFTEKEFEGDGYHISPLHYLQLKWMLEQAGFRIDSAVSNQYSGLINFSGIKIFASSLLMLPFRIIMKPKNKAILEGDILIVKARKAG